MQRQPGGNRQFREWSNITAQCTEVLWNQVRPTLPTKKKTNAKEGTVVVLGEQLIPEKHKLILQRGPKFCFEPVLNRVEKLRISRVCVPVPSYFRHVSKEVRSTMHGPGRRPDPTQAASVAGSEASRLFFVSDKNSSFRFLLYTGAEVGTLPVTSITIRPERSNVTLQAANESAIGAYGERALTLNPCNGQAITISMSGAPRHVTVRYKHAVT
ncbi:hypothetical protein HPB47_028071 [Ixodes persulcatus]|uniref:Uncharacterized protein n=1 Tax=Ixodes persulcatus TaxID=34615 RepID=A0AC60PU69_IXOPE|nr:hypothetical protein HPB47_028071 [Ixodes persulcatus]